MRKQEIRGLIILVNTKHIRGKLINKEFELKEHLGSVYQIEHIDKGSKLVQVMGRPELTKIRIEVDKVFCDLEHEEKELITKWLYQLYKYDWSGFNAARDAIIKSLDN